MKCLECKKPTNNPKFCQQSCSAKYNNSQRMPRTVKSRLKTSNSVKRFHKNNPNYIQPGIRCKVIFHICLICDSPFYNKASQLLRKACSSKCTNELIRQSAIRQMRKGAGKQGWYKNIWCHSTWELAFLIWHFDHNKSISRPNILINYDYEGRTHQYEPDFIIDGLLYEIKGYDSKRAKAKLDAAHQQGYLISVLYKDKIKFYLDYVKSTYNTYKIESLYEDYEPPYKIKCQECLEIFNTSRKDAKFCSKSCSGLYLGNKKYI